MFMGFPGGLDGKESACNMGELGSIPGLGRFPGEGNSYPLQYSCLENSMDREFLMNLALMTMPSQTFSIYLAIQTVLKRISSHPI